MGISIEWVTGIIRGGKDHHKFGDPYEFSCTILKDRDTVYLKGAVGHLYTHFRSELREEFVKEGIKKVLWETKENNGTYKITDIGIG